MSSEHFKKELIFPMISLRMGVLQVSNVTSFDGLPNFINELTIPHARQLCFFRIMVKGVPQSMHFWMDSIFNSLGCFRPISDSSGLNISRPIRSDDFFWYNSLIVWKRYSNQSSFSARVLKVKEIYDLKKKLTKQ